MKKNFALLFVFLMIFNGCSDDDDNVITDNPVAPAQTTFRFTHDWDGTAVTGEDFESTDYVTEKGDDITIGPRFRYLISQVTFTNADGEDLVLNGHNLIDVGDTSPSVFATYNPETLVPVGEYTNVSFTYGFKDEDNVTDIHTDLNSASFNVPGILGGGYHFMQLDGKYRTNTGDVDSYNYHNIRAVNPNLPDGPPVFVDQPTFINVDLGPVVITGDTTIEVKMNVAEWFKGPNLWDLNVLNQILMPNPVAQKMMNENGQNVFSVGEISVTQ